LAQKLYVAHLTQLKHEIQSLEDEFLTTTQEIEAIERGEWDERFQQQITEQNGTVEDTGLKRGRGGRKKREEGQGEEEEQEDEEPPAKRSRVASEDEVKEEPIEEEMEVAPSVPEPPETTEPEKTGEPETSGEGPVEPIQLEEPEQRTEEDQEQEEREPPPSPTPPTKVPTDLDQGEETEEEEEPANHPATLKLDSDQEHESDGPLVLVQTLIVVDAASIRPKKAFPTLISPLNSSLLSLKSATLFSNPIRELDAPGYANLIKKPMDLKTLWKLVKDGTINDSKVYHREVLRMFANAIMYNAENCMPRTFGVTDIAAVAEMSRDMAMEGDQLCEGYRKSENFATVGGRRKRKG